MNKKRLNFILIILIYFFIYLIFKKNSALSNITFLSLKIFITKVFPFLFIMMTLNNFLIKCNLPYYFNKIFKNQNLYIFFSSIISGSPINAIILKNFLDSKYISLKEASILLSCTCFNNPLFLYSYLFLIFNNIHSVIKIMAILYILNIVIFIYLTNKMRISVKQNYKDYNLKKELFNSIYDSMQNLIKIMGIIVFFKIILDLTMTKNSLLFVIFKGLIEITTGLNSLNTIYVSIKIKEIISYIIISFMGFSIQMQISIILEKFNIDYKYFYLSRLFLIITGIIIILIV